jgi:hypothetical protein
MGTFSGKKFIMLGVVFLFLAVCALLLTWYFSGRAPEPDVIEPGAIVIPDVTGNKATDEDGILDQIKFKEAHEMYQQSYLQTINEINNLDTTNIDVKKYRYFFSDYEKSQKHYQRTLKKVEDYRKDFKIKCFARMRSLILAVLFHDRKLKKKMTRFNPDLLIEIGALNKMPECPSGGKYSIIYKDGRRFFHCSVHGILKN